MKIQLISDIHLEFSTDLELPGGDVLVIAGDMAEARSFFRNDGGGMRQQAENLKNWLNNECPKYNEVVYVLGNHEFYNRSLQEAPGLMRKVLPNNVRMLENQTIKLSNDYQVFGGTLWTDLNGGDSPAT